jgi:hypothetical protein
MAGRKRAAVNIAPPNLETIDPQAVIAGYDDESDTLIVHLSGRERPAVIWPGPHQVDLRVDPATNEVIGLQIEGYLTRAVFDAPYLLDLAELTDLGAERIARVREQSAPARHKHSLRAAFRDQWNVASA